MGKDFDSDELYGGSKNDTVETSFSNDNLDLYDELKKKSVHNNTFDFPKPLTKEKEKEILLQYAESHDTRSFEKLVIHNLRLVAYIAKRYNNIAIDYEELISVGTIGLIKAIKKYQMDKGYQLTTFASTCINNEILLYIRNNKKGENNLALETPIANDSIGNTLTYEDVLYDKDYDIFDVVFKEEINHILLKRALEKLDDKEKQLIKLRYLGYQDNKNQKEIAELLGVSQAQVSRTEKKILLKMKKTILKES